MDPPPWKTCKTWDDPPATHDPARKLIFWKMASGWNTTSNLLIRPNQPSPPPPADPSSSLLPPAPLSVTDPEVVCGGGRWMVPEDFDFLYNNYTKIIALLKKVGGREIRLNIRNHAKLCKNVRYALNGRIMRDNPEHVFLGRILIAHLFMTSTFEHMGQACG